MKISFVSLGCSKNLVDSEKLIYQLKLNGCTVEHNPENSTAPIIIINTCGFIGDAKEESIQMILEATKTKAKKIFVFGCLSEKYFQELQQEIPEVTAWYGKFNYLNILDDLGLKRFPDGRSITTPPHYAYLKIAEGCNRSCSYCAIPTITGKYKSRSIENLVDEATLLRDNGVKELQLIAQDLTSYGVDLYKSLKLTELVHKLSEIEGIEWIRLHYGYPAGFPLDLLPEMAQNPKICNYLDIALQHISDNMLKLMKRNITKQQTLELIHTIREKVPNIHLRTTLITGHPGETEDDFGQLLHFVKTTKFERLGVFPYSHEIDTYSYNNYKDDIPQAIKEARAEEIMATQCDISTEICRQKIGQTLKIIVDRQEADYYIGRTEFDSPEVDGEVIINSPNLSIGTFYNLKITDSTEYDLIV